MSQRKALLFVHLCLSIAVAYVPGAMAADTKVEICHIPPGNPDNPQTITISEAALSAHLDHGDRIGACDLGQSAERRESESPTATSAETPAETSAESSAATPAASRADSACACPRPGVWRVTNLEGYMECNVMGIKRKLKGAGKNDGAIWILNDDCSTIYSEAYEKDAEDVYMERGRECLYFGFAPGEEEGAEVLFDGAYKLENEEFITGEFYLEMSGAGVGCSGFRPFEIEFLKPLDEKDYAKREKKMQAKLEATRAALDESSEQIDNYLEDTDGGKAFGGRNVQ